MNTQTNEFINESQIISAPQSSTTERGHGTTGNDPNDIFASLAAACRRQGGGFTLDLRKLKRAKAGYVVSIYPNITTCVPAAKFNAGDIRDFTSDNEECLGWPGHHLGAWHNSETRLVELDISIVVPDRDTALLLAAKHNQKAIYDMAGQEEIRLSGEEVLTVAA